MPLSDRLTRSTSEACSSIDRFLWMTPMPPCCAIAIARRDSVTVSIAALASGTFSRILRVNDDETSTALGSTVECCGTSRTSSKVSAVVSPIETWSALSTSVRVYVFIQRLPAKKADNAVGLGLGAPQARWGCRRGDAPRSLSGTMTFLVFLSTAAGAGIVASHLRLVAPDLPHDIVAAAARGPWRLGDGRCAPARPDRAKRRRGRGCRTAERHRRRPAWRRTRCRGHARFGAADHRHQPPQVADDLLVDAFPHGLEQREALFLVLDERIALAVAAKADAFLQVIEAVKVVLPLRIDDLQHDVALDVVQDRRIVEERFFLFILRERQFPDGVGHLVRRAPGKVQRLRFLLVEPEDFRDRLCHRVQIPF